MATTNDIKLFSAQLRATYSSMESEMAANQRELDTLSQDKVERRLDLSGIERRKNKIKADHFGPDSKQELANLKDTVIDVMRRHEALTLWLADQESRLKKERGCCFRLTERAASVITPQRLQYIKAIVVLCGSAVLYSTYQTLANQN